MSTSTRHKSVGETSRKLMIDKFLAKAYLDDADYNKFMEIVDILKHCDKTAKEMLKLGSERESDDS